MKEQGFFVYSSLTSLFDFSYASLDDFLNPPLLSYENNIYKFSSVKKKYLMFHKFRKFHHHYLNESYIFQSVVFFQSILLLLLSLSLSYILSIFFNNNWIYIIYKHFVPFFSKATPLI